MDHSLRFISIEKEMQRGCLGVGLVKATGFEESVDIQVICLVAHWICEFGTQ